MATQPFTIPPAPIDINFGKKKPVPKIQPGGQLSSLMSSVGGFFSRSAERGRQQMAARPTTPTPSFQYPTTSVGGFTLPASFGGTPIGSPKPAVPTATPTATNLNYNLPAPAPTFTKPTVPQIKPVSATSAAPATPTTPTGIKIDAQGNPILPSSSTTESSGTTSTPSSPAAPTLSPETAKAVAAAEKAVEGATKISPEELSTQEDLDKLVQSARTAYTNIQGQPIPLEFITGQLAATERRALDLAEPLERKLGRLQAARTSSLEASKFALGRADKAVEAARGEAKDIRIETESARRFGVEQKGAEDTRALAAKKFEEDKRQFGLNYALEQQKLANDKAKKDVEKTEKEATVKSESLQNLSLVNEILGSSKLNLVTGLSRFSPTAFLPGANLIKRQIEQLQSVLSLDNRQKLKGSGAISDFEARTLQAAATALDRDLSNEGIRVELNKIKGAFATSAGLEADVKVTSPSGEVVVATASRKEIDSLIAEGNKVEYR